MPINAFGGGPGSGKTYGVVEHVILPAVSAGRFLITNIEGLDDEAIYEYVASRAPKGKIVCIGHIRCCSRSSPGDADFFPTEAALDKALPVPSPEYPRVWGGDLVVIDEATRYWAQGDKIPKSHEYFFREHRHFANELGHTCDLVVIDPDLTLLARPLKGKIELASVTHKPKEIGLNRYVVNLYRGVRLTRKPLSTQGPYAFRKEIYSLYKSYSHDAAKEQSIDKRQNVLLNPRTLLFMAFILLLGVGSLGGAFYLWTKQKAQFKKAEGGEPVGSAATGSAKPSSSVSGSASGASVASVASPAHGGDRSATWRVAGYVSVRGAPWIVVADVESGALRLENPAAFVGRGALVVGTVDGRKVTTFSGMVRSSSGSAVGLPR